MYIVFKMSYFPIILITTDINRGVGFFGKLVRMVHKKTKQKKQLVLYG